MVFVRELSLLKALDGAGVEADDCGPVCDPLSGSNAAECSAVADGSMHIQASTAALSSTSGLHTSGAEECALLESRCCFGCWGVLRFQASSFRFLLLLSTWSAEAVRIRLAFRGCTLTRLDRFLFLRGTACLARIKSSKSAERNVTKTIFQYLNVTLEPGPAKLSGQRF